LIRSCHDTICVILVTFVFLWQQRALLLTLQIVSSVEVPRFEQRTHESTQAWS
jgi:hypothetical protein